MTSGFWYSHGSYPVYGSQSSSILDRSEADKVQAGFDKIIAPTGYGNYLTKYNSAETGISPTNVSVTDSGLMTIFGGIVVSGGTVIIPSPGSGANEAATKGYADNLAFTAALPGQNATTKGKVPISGGASGIAAWGLLSGSTIFLAQTAGAF